MRRKKRNSGFGLIYDHLRKLQNKFLDPTEYFGLLYAQNLSTGSKSAPLQPAQPAGQVCYKAPPQRPPGDFCSITRSKISAAARSDPGDRTKEREMLSPFPFPSLRRLLFKETLPSKKGIAAALGFPPDHPCCHTVTLPFQGFAERCCVEN